MKKDAPKKAPATKKATTTTAKKPAAPKKATATKAKANTSKPRKTSVSVVAHLPNFIY